MQNSLLKFRKSSIISQKTGYLSVKLKTTIKFNIFCWNFAHVRTYQNLQNGVQEFFNFFRSWVVDEPCFCETRPFLILANNFKRFKQNKKNPEHPFVAIGKWKTCAKRQQKLLNSMVVEARENFQFFAQSTWFFGNSKALSTFSYAILHCLISITRLQKQITP